jgi:hypothetical protein
MGVWNGSVLAGQKFGPTNPQLPLNGIGNIADPVDPQDVATKAYVDAHAGGGGFGAGGQDLSVNKASVIGRVLHTQTGPNLAGGYNGGGVGNKALLGLSGFSGASLAGLKLRMIWTSVLGDPAVLATHPFFNLILDINATGVFAVVSISDTLPPASDANLVVTPLGGGKFQYDFDASINTFQVVTLAAIPAAIPVVNNGPAFFQRAYNAAGILAAYPATVLRDASSLDGGLPNTTVTTAIMVALGDSGNVAMLTRTINDLEVNGTPV